MASAYLSVCRKNKGVQVQLMPFVTMPARVGPQNLCTTTRVIIYFSTSLEAFKKIILQSSFNYSTKQAEKTFFSFIFDAPLCCCVVNLLLIALRSKAFVTSLG